MEKQTEVAALPSIEEEPIIVNGEEFMAVRDFVIRGLAYAVPEFLDRDKAADLLVAWFPGDRLALASLYKTIHHNLPLQAA